jgi:ankyrin repeat protein
MSTLPRPLPQGSTAPVKVDPLDLFAAMKAANPKLAVSGAIARGATETMDQGMNTPLILSIINNNREMFNILSRKGGKMYVPNLDAVNNDGNTPLLIATTNGNFDFVRTLLTNGANPNVTDESGLTPLSIANKAENVDIMKSLIAKKADVNVTLEDPNSGQQVSQLLYAAANGNINTVNAILSGNPDVDAADPVDGSTALILAARKGDVEVVKALLAKGAKVDVENTNSETALSIAEANGNTDIQEALSGATGGGRRRGSKTRGRKTRGRKTRGRKTRGRKGKKRTVRR